MSISKTLKCSGPVRILLFSTVFVFLLGAMLSALPSREGHLVRAQGKQSTGKQPRKSGFYNLISQSPVFSPGIGNISDVSCMVGAAPKRQTNTQRSQ